jgi:hypothetical protein
MSQIDPSPTPRRASSFTTGILMMLMGGLVLAIGFGLIPTDPSQIHAPRWLIALFGGMFILAGLWANLKQAIRQDTTQAGWINFIFALLVMLAITVICLWIGFGPGQRLFFQDSGNFVDPTRIPIDPTLGRIFFGIFGLLMAGVTVAFAVLQGRKMLRAG